MDTTADYKALYLKKFFQWQDICHQQSIKIEELKKEITELKKQSQTGNTSLRTSAIAGFIMVKMMKLS